MLKKIDIVIGALSGHKYEDRRNACRETWAISNERVKTVFILGECEKSSRLPVLHSPDELYVPSTDAYSGLTMKTAWFLEWALNTYDFKYVFKCDDDTYVDVPRLLSLSDAAKDDYIGREWQGHSFASGGAGYLLSRDAARSIVRRSWAIDGAEDVITAQVLRQAGISLTKDSRLYWGNDVVPNSHNDMITAHWLSPAQMRKVHTDYGKPLKPIARIPAIFHFIWLGSSLPDQFRRYVESWSALHPGWEVKIWNDATRPKLINEAEFMAAKTFAQKADILRYELLYEYGGVYLDTDMECHCNIGTLLVDVQAFAAREDDSLIAIGAMGAVPKHPAFKAIIDAIPHSAKINPTNIVHATGPGLATVVWKDRKDLHIFPPNIFYPTHYSGRVWPGPSYATHHWSMSWKK